MGKAIIFVCFVWLFLGCQMEIECPKEIVMPINPAFVNWTKPYPIDTIGYARYKSNKGTEESLLIERDMYYNEWYLQNISYDEPCVTKRSEWRNYSLTSTIYKKWINVDILQYSPNETRLYIENKSSGYDAGSINFSPNNSYSILKSPCDTCLHLFDTYLVNNKTYSNVIRMHCIECAKTPGPESIKEIYFAEGYGIIQYTCSDSTVWNLVN